VKLKAGKASVHCGTFIVHRRSLLLDGDIKHGKNGENKKRETKNEGMRDMTLPAREDPNKTHPN
jgi:hypothetical protein